MCQEDSGCYRRPNPMVENEINQWKQLVDRISTISYITNTGLIFLTSNVFQGKSSMEKFVHCFLFAGAIGLLHIMSRSKHAKDEKLGRAQRYMYFRFRIYQKLF